MPKKKSNNKENQTIKSSLGWKIIKFGFFCIFSSLLIGAALLGVLFYIYVYDSTLPNFRSVQDYRPKLVSHVYSADGQLIGEIFGKTDIHERRSLVPMDKIPLVLKNAVIDAEDASFYEHKGVNFVRMGIELVRCIVYRQRCKGASSITQQFVKGYVLQDSSRTAKRKLPEIYLALQIEKNLSKESILWMYLMNAHFGGQTYGVEEASKKYFGISVTDINLSQAATLAAMLPGQVFAPDHSPQAAKNRQRYVLSQMLRYHHISAQEAESASNEPIAIIKNPYPYLGTIANEFVSIAEAELNKLYSREQVPYLGVNIYTTCKVAIQTIARTAAQEGLRNIDIKNHYRSPLRSISSPVSQAKYITKLAQKYPTGPDPSKIIEGIITSISPPEPSSPAKAQVSIGTVSGILPLPPHNRYNILKPNQKDSASLLSNLKPGDILRVRALQNSANPTLTLENGPQVAVVVIDPTTRHILAMVGNYEGQKDSFNNATSAKRLPGSAMKPFVFGAAIDSKKYTAATMVLDSPQVFNLPNNQQWSPRGHDYQGLISLRMALARSSNPVAGQIIADIGPESVIRFAQQTGITSPLEANLSLALGTSPVSPLELTNSYATIAADGRYKPPISILSIAQQKLTYPEEKQTISPDVAHVLRSIMTSVITDGTARRANTLLKYTNVFGKTGTNGNGDIGTKDAWFVGCTPSLCVGVWVGFPDMKSLGKSDEGAKDALPIFEEIIEKSMPHQFRHIFTPPPSVSLGVKIDPKTGLLAAPGAPYIEEVFIQGTEPKQEAIAPNETDPKNYTFE